MYTSLLMFASWHTEELRYIWQGLTYNSSTTEDDRGGTIISIVAVV